MGGWDVARSRVCKRRFYQLILLVAFYSSHYVRLFPTCDFLARERKEESLSMIFDGTYIRERKFSTVPFSKEDARHLKRDTIESI